MIPTVHIKKKSNLALTVAIVIGIVAGICSAAFILSKIFKKKKKPSENSISTSWSDECNCSPDCSCDEDPGCVRDAFRKTF